MLKKEIMYISTSKMKRLTILTKEEMTMAETFFAVLEVMESLHNLLLPWILKFFELLLLHALEIFIYRKDFVRSKASLGPTFRSSRPEVFCNEGVVKIFAKFAGKHLCWNLFLKKICKFIKNETPTQLFSHGSCEIFKNIFVIEFNSPSDCFCNFQ